jgi:hypothetical protein
MPAKPVAPADPVAAVLRQLARSPDQVVRRWARKLGRGEAVAGPKAGTKVDKVGSK